MDSTGCHASTAHDTGIDIMKLRVGMVLRLSRQALLSKPNPRHQPRLYIANLLPERGHIHNQVLDDR
jgi:hypothetical protein